jgi:3-oxoacyl-[acyl-carrier protein] reductase
MELNIQGKSAIVTGGGTGIGAGICEALAQEGVDVGINYIVDREEVQEFADDLNRKYNTNCKPLYADISKPADLDAMLSEALETYGKIDIIVNNAGIWPTEDVLDMPDENWERVIDIVLNGPLMLSKRAARSMIENKIKGTIINISSKSGFTYNTAGHAHYATAKAGINMMTKTLAREFAPHGIRVNGLAPGMVRTPINEDKWSDPEAMKTYVKRIPAGKFALPVEIGYVIAFLASEKSDNIIGTVLDVTGGMLI